VFSDFTSLPIKFQYPVGICCTPDGHLLIGLHGGAQRVLVFKEDGKFISSIEGNYLSKKIFITAGGVVMMNNGDIVIADISGNKLVVF